jgi:hypothetical protein
VPVKVAADVLYVLDDMIATGATYRAFRSAFCASWPNVRTVLLAYVFSPKPGTLFER